MRSIEEWSFNLLNFNPRISLSYLLCFFITLQLYVGSGLLFGNQSFKNWYNSHFEPFGFGGWRTFFHLTDAMSPTYDVVVLGDNDTINRKYVVDDALSDTVNRYFLFTEYLGSVKEPFLKDICLRFSRYLRVEGTEKTKIFFHNTPTRSFKNFYIFDSNEYLTSTKVLVEC